MTGLGWLVPRMTLIAAAGIGLAVGVMVDWRIGIAIVLGGAVVAAAESRLFKDT